MLTRVLRRAFGQRRFVETFCLWTKAVCASTLELCTFFKGSPGLRDFLVLLCTSEAPSFAFAVYNLFYIFCIYLSQKS
jgi:hypothetical protein